MIKHFHTPATVREAVGLKRRYRARAAYLAGGTWLNSTESGGPPEHVISLARLGLDRVETKPGRVVFSRTASTPWRSAWTSRRPTA